MVGGDRVGTAPVRLPGVRQRRGLLHADAFKWALALVNSCAVFLDERLCLVPVFDLANHRDKTSANDMPQELLGSSFGTSGTTKGARLLTTSGKDSGTARTRRSLPPTGPKRPQTTSPSTPFSLIAPSVPPPVRPLRLT